MDSVLTFAIISKHLCNHLLAWVQVPFYVYRHFDKDKSGKLDHVEFKSCLRALGYDLPMVNEGESDPEFQAILDMVGSYGSCVLTVQRVGNSLHVLLYLCVYSKCR